MVAIWGLDAVGDMKQGIAVVRVIVLSWMALAGTLLVSRPALACAPWEDMASISETNLPACATVVPVHNGNGVVQIDNQCSESVHIEGDPVGCPDCDDPLDLAPGSQGSFTVSYASTPTTAPASSFTLTWSTASNTGTIELSVTHFRGGCPSEPSSESESGCAVSHRTRGSAWWLLLFGLLGTRARLAARRVGRSKD